MKLHKYAFESTSPDEWKVSELSFGDINLLAGVSGVGKTRILNTINNLGLSIQRKKGLLFGCWSVDIEIKKKIYKYHLDVKKDENKRNYIFREFIKIEDEVLFDRNNSEFQWDTGTLPNLGDEDIGIYILRNEDKIKDIYEAFSKVYLRRPCLLPEDPRIERLGGVTEEIISGKPDRFSLRAIKENISDFNIQMFLINQFHHDIFKKIEMDFRDIFPFVTQLEIKQITEVEILRKTKLPIGVFIPVLVFREKNVNDAIPQTYLSSGMLKALFQLFDIYTIPDDSIYMIDEIENSMGVNSLPVLVDILKNRSKRMQLIFTSHHPYIIRNFDMKYWQVLRRTGSVLKVVSGEKLKERFSKSAQDIYLQLINSELIEEGI